MMVLKEKQMRVILALKGGPAYLSGLAKETGTTYVFVTHFASSLAKKGIVSIEPAGKKKMVRLTERGQELAGHLEEAKKRLE